MQRDLSRGFRDNLPELQIDPVGSDSEADNKDHTLSTSGDEGERTFGLPFEPRCRQEDKR